MTSGKDVRQVTVPFALGNAVFSLGELVAGNHPAVRSHPEYFGDLKVREADMDVVEQATANPGEKRQTRSRKREQPEPEPEVVPEPEPKSETSGLKKADVPYTDPLKKK